jgi:Domain of unknown function (DUF4169)
MAEIINLRRARKSKQREADAKTADENRVKFGRSKTEKEHTAANQTLEARKLDGLKRTDD